MKIEELFQDWVDFDVAEYYIGCLLGVMKYDDTFQYFRMAKGVFNTKNPIGDLLYRFLEELVAVGMLETDDNGYRWNKLFTAYWYEKDEDAVT